MKEAILEPLLRKMRLSRVLPTIKSFNKPNVLDVGCGWEAKLIQEIEPFIAKGVGVDFKAPSIRTDKIHTFSYFFESKDSVAFSGWGGWVFGGGGDMTQILKPQKIATYLLKMRVLKW